MIKTLYLRMVITFSAAVLLSMGLSFHLFFFFNGDRLLTKTHNDLLHIGEELAAMSQHVEPGLLIPLLESISRLNESVSLALADDEGRLQAIRADESETLSKLNRSVVTRVLQGEAYENKSLRDPDAMIIGLPLTVGGRSYALFISPHFSPAARSYAASAILTVLALVLCIGSFLIAIVSRYIVHPIKKLTSATQALARGNFDVQIKLKLHDEIGILLKSFNSMAAKLQKLEQMRQDFVSNVSHEIQSPLTSIRGYSKALRQNGMKEEDRKRYLEIIERESERLSRLSDNLLKLVSLQSEHHPFHPTTFDLAEQLRRIVVTLEPQWSAKQLELQLDLPKVKFRADADQMNQVWMNLLSNAIKFTPAGGRILVRLTALTDKVKVLIQDSGIGISAEDQERIFERFYKADASRDKKTDGSGLGLSIVRTIVELHGGAVEVASKPGQGSAFTITLPIVSYSESQS